MLLDWRADMTRLAISLLPTFGYFSLLLLAGCALYLNCTFWSTFVVMAWEAIEAAYPISVLSHWFIRMPLDPCQISKKNSLVNQIIHLLSIDLDSPWNRCLPMSRKYYNSLRLNLGSDFFSNLLQLAVNGMIHIIHDVRLSPINQRPHTLKRQQEHLLLTQANLHRHERRYESTSVHTSPKKKKTLASPSKFTYK